MAIQNTKTLENLAENQFELPVGFTDKNGVFHKTFTLQEMTGKVDEAIADRKVRTNPGKMVTELINGVVTQIGDIKMDKMIARQLSNPDRDYILLMNYLYSLGETIEWEDVCPVCREKMQVELEVANINVNYMTEDEPRILELELPRGIKHPVTGELHKHIKVSLPNGMVQERVFGTVAKNPNAALTMILQLCTEEIKGMSTWDIETFQNMSKRDRKFVNEAIDSVQVGADMFAELECPECGHEFKSTVPLMELMGE